MNPVFSLSFFDKWQNQKIILTAWWLHFFLALQIFEMNRKINASDSVCKVSVSNVFFESRIWRTHLKKMDLVCKGLNRKISFMHLHILFQRSEYLKLTEAAKLRIIDVLHCSFHDYSVNAVFKALIQRFRHYSGCWMKKKLCLLSKVQWI